MTSVTKSVETMLQNPSGKFMLATAAALVATIVTYSVYSMTTVGFEIMQY